MKYTVMQWFTALLLRDYAFFQEDIPVDWAMLQQIQTKRMAQREAESQ